jgi:hypothetical protein
MPPADATIRVVPAPDGAEVCAALDRAAAPTIEDLRSRPEVHGLEPIAVRRDQAAALFSVGVATWDRWNSSGVVGPVPVKRGGVLLWNLAELREWGAAGMPGRKEWLARRAAPACAIGKAR